MALKAGRKGVRNSQVDAYGNIHTEIPVASSTEIGGVKPVSKTEGMTQDVGVDSAGKLYTTPAAGLQVATPTTLGGVKPVAKTEEMTQDVGVDSEGKLYISPPQASGGEFYYKDYNANMSSYDYWYHTAAISESGYTPVFAVGIDSSSGGHIGLAGLFKNRDGQNEIRGVIQNPDKNSSMKIRVYFVPSSTIHSLT